MDYCVFATAVDAHDLGFKTNVVVDATRGVAPDTSEEAKKKLTEKGITLIQSTEIWKVLFICLIILINK